MRITIPEIMATHGEPRRSEQLNVGIVGGGIAGLYTALYLQHEGHRVHIFEGTERIGGRVHTHYFSPERDQYYEAGAMRIPQNKFQDIFFDLVGYINQRVTAERKINLIRYILTNNNNLVYINGIQSQVAAFDTTPAMLEWPEIPEKYQKRTAKDLLREAVGPLIQALTSADDFEDAFRKMVNDFDQYTFRYYCVDVMKWSNSLIDFVETMASQTNQFNLSVPELVMQSLDFGVSEWMTIADGMSRLPEAMAHLVGLENITYGARVTGIQVCRRGGNKATITAMGYNGTLKAAFDHVVLAVPPAALRMIADRPRWRPEKEMAIRALHFEPLYKMGLRFKTRFWEQVTPRPSFGGQSTTDLPIRWIVYPSNGIHHQAEDSGEEAVDKLGDGNSPGVLMVYSWMTDATNWLPLTPLERRSVAMNCLAKVYNGKIDINGNPIDVHKLYIESADHVWASSTATGDAMFLPGQFAEHFDAARKHEGPIYFAGEHLSFHHTWMAGAADSALKVVRDMLHCPELRPLGPLLTAGDGDEAPPGVDAPFHFRPNNPMFRSISDFNSHFPGHLSYRWPPRGYDFTPEEEQPGNLSIRQRNEPNDGSGGGRNDDPERHNDGADGAVPKLPSYLGMPDENPIGVVSAKFTSPVALASWTMGRVQLS